MRRFYSDQPIDSESVVLADSEAHHLIHVLRASVGDEVTLFDGSGREFTGRVDSLGRSDVTLAIIQSTEVDRESPILLNLAVAMPKTDRQRWLVEKCVELGVHKLLPLVTQRSVNSPRGKNVDKLRRSVIEASKQCGRNVLMEISDPISLEEWTSLPGPQKWIAFPTASTTLSGLGKQQHDRMAIAIGPEGGFTPDEVECAMERGCESLRLGPTILRIETAALAVAAAALTWR